MSIKEQLAALAVEGQTLRTKSQEDPEGFTDDDATRVEEVLKEHGRLKAIMDRNDAVSKSLAGISRIEVNEPEQLGEEPTGKTMGERFIKSAAFKAFKDSNPTGLGTGTPVHVSAKGIGGINDLIRSKATIDSTTGQVRTEREPGYRNYLAVDEPLTFLDLITTGVTNLASADYAQIVAETDNAAIVAEGQLKPLSDVTTALKDSKAFTYADGFDITNQTLADDGALAVFMESRIRRHVLGVVEDKILNGTGTSIDPEGILNTVGTLSQVFATDVVTTLAAALEKFATNNGNSAPQAIVMNPADVWALRLLKGTDGHYLLGNPLQQGPIPTPWGVPLVQSNRVAVATALVGRFDSVNFLQLEALNVLAFNQHKDYAQRNMVYVRAELRGRQLFYAPREVVVASLTV